MTEILTLAATTSGVVTAVFTAILCFATWVLAKETKRLSDATSQPHVTATLEPNQWTLMYYDVLVQNSGNAVAYDIEISFDPPINVSDKFRAGLQPPFSKVSILRPAQTLKSALCAVADVKDQAFVVTISWKRHPQHTRRDAVHYTLAMSDYNGVSSLGEASPEVQIAREVKKIREDWHSVARGQRKLRTDIYSSEDRATERAKQEEWRREVTAQDQAGPKDNNGSEGGPDGNPTRDPG